MTDAFFSEELNKIIDNALLEDIGDGDHSSLACIDENATGKARLMAKDSGVIAGVDLAKKIANRYDSQLKITVFIPDGTKVEYGQIVLEILGNLRSILATERLILNFMQRMSGIATQTNKLVELIKDTPAKILDTRKTTPGIRLLEKWAVRIGGAQNHRYALYDMIMLKDNHIDYAGGIRNAILKTKEYLNKNNKILKIEVEVRNLQELKEVLVLGQVDRIMLDNFTPQEIQNALSIIPQNYEVEASGGINADNILEYAKTGVEYISIGAITHSFKSLDMSLKAV